LTPTPLLQQLLKANDSANAAARQLLHVNVDWLKVRAETFAAIQLLQVVHNHATEAASKKEPLPRPLGKRWNKELIHRPPRKRR
jgi:hypothetical protein